MNRLERAANFLDGLADAAVAGGDADPGMVEKCSEIANALRSAVRTDMDKAVWASVFFCLKIKGDLAAALANELTFAEGKEF